MRSLSSLSIATVLYTVLSVLPSNLISASPISNTVYPNDTVLRTIYQFPNITWNENLAIRSNGQILVSHITAPELWQVDPTGNGSAGTAELVYRFPNATGATGIAEVEEDVFLVSVGNFTYSNSTSTPGSYSVWRIDFHSPKKNGAPKVRKVTSIPEANNLNGATSLHSAPGTALVGDTGRGVVYRVDARTGSYRVAFSDPALEPNASIATRVGVNGLRAIGPSRGAGAFVHFVNTFRYPFYGRIPVSAQGDQIGPVQVIDQLPTFPTYHNASGDDFTVDKKGNTWLAAVGNMLVKISPQGHQTIIAGGVDDPGPLKGCKSAAFGRTEETKDLLYIVTDGGLKDPALGTEGGRVLVLDTTKL